MTFNTGEHIHYLTPRTHEPRTGTIIDHHDPPHTCREYRIRDDDGFIVDCVPFFSISDYPA